MKRLPVAVDAPQHPGPGPVDDEHAALVPGGRLAVFADDRGGDAEHRLARRSRARWWSRPAGGVSMWPPVSVCHQVSTIGAVAAADFFVVPDPGLGVDGLADRPEHLQRREVVLLDVLITPLHEGPDRGRGGVELRDAVAFDDVPEAVAGGEVRGALVHQRGHAVGQQAVDDVAVAGDPAAVGGAPVDVDVVRPGRPGRPVPGTRAGGRRLAPLRAAGTPSPCPARSKVSRLVR